MNFFFKNFILILIFFCSEICFSQNIRTVNGWESLFLKNWDKEYAIARKQSKSNDSWQFYNLAYSLDANITMFQATGKTIYLDRAILYTNDMISSAVVSSKIDGSQYRDNYLGWANHSSPAQGNDCKEYPLFESFCWRYVSTLLYVMNEPALLANKVYRKHFNRILYFTETNIYKKWTVRGMDNIYRSNTHMSSHWARIAMDLYLITGKVQYKKVVYDFVTKFQKQKRINPNKKNAVTWQSGWDSKYGSVQDVGHGNAVVSTIIEMYERRIAFSKKDINALLLSFDKVIWKSDYAFASHFDGSGKGTGWFTDGLIKLGRYDVDLQKRIEKHNKGRSTQFFGNGALNARILITGKPLYPKI
jgi:hypothetical protein